MKRKSILTPASFLVVFAALGLTVCPLHAATYSRLNNTTTLDLAGAWSAGGPPTSADAAQWDSTDTGNLSTLLAASANWAEIIIANNAAGAITIGSAHGASPNYTPTYTLTLNGIGDGANTAIDMSAANQNLTIYPNVVLNANQTWNVGSGRILYIGAKNTDRPTISGSYGITKTGAGVLDMGSANPTLSYTGPTTVNSGILVLYGNKPAGNFTLNNGILDDYYRQSYTFSGGLGTGNNQVQITGGTCGFGAGNQGSTWQIGTALSTLQWGSSYFKPDVLQLLCSYDNLAANWGEATLNNGLDLNGGARTIYVLAGSGSGAAASCWGKITGVIKDVAGGGSLIKTGGGNLILSGANTYTGATTVSAGTLRAGVASVAGTSGAFGNNSAVSLANVATAVLDLNGFATQIGSLTGGGATGGNVTLGSATLTVGSDGTSPAAYAGVISGTGGLTKSGGGTLTLSGANTYSGTTALSGGKLAVSGSLSSTPTLTLATSGTTLQLGNGGASGTINTAAAISIGSGVTFAVNRSDTVTQGTQFSAAAISGAGNFSQVGGGTTVLNAANSYTGVTTVSGGTLSVATLANGGSNSGIGASTNAAAKLVLNGGTLQYTGAGASTDRQFTLGTSGGAIDASGSGAINWTSTTALSFSVADNACTLTLTGANTGANTLAAPVGDNGLGATALAKSGAGTWVLTGANTYSGNTSINGGTLQLDNGGTTGTLNTASAISVGSGAVFAVNHSDTVTQGAQFSSAGISGTGGFSQIGSGTTILNVDNSYTGPTTVNNGMLLVNGSLAADSAVSVNGGTLGGNGAIYGSVTLGASGFIAPGASAGTAGMLTIANLDVSALGKLNFDLDTTSTSDQIAVTGTLNIGTGVFGRSQFNFNLLGGYGAGTYTLITTSGGISGFLNTGDVSGILGGKLYTLQVNGTNLELVVSTPVSIPLVANVTSTLADGSYTTGTVIDLTVSFTIPVVVNTTGGTPTLRLATGTTLENAVYLGGSGSTNLTFRYIVQAGDNSSGHLDYTGTSALALNGGTIQDASTGTQSANLALSTPGTVGSLGNNKALVIDTAAPTVANVSSALANGSYTTGTTVDVTMTFSEPVTVDTTGGTPSLLLATTPAENAVYLSGSGSSVLTFRYTVQAGDNTSGSLDYTDVSPLALNGATIKDPAGNDATLILPLPGSAGSLSVNKALVIDTTAPTVTSIVDNTSGETAGVGDLITYTITFNEAMSAATVVAGDFDNADTAGITVGAVSQTSSSVYTVQVTPTSSGTLTLRIKGSAVVTDVAGNNLVVPVSASATVTVHNVTVTWDANGTGAGQTDGNGVWLNPSQWWNGSANASWAAGLDAAFGNGGTGGAVTLASPTTVNSITMNSFGGTYTLGSTGQTITNNGGLTMNSGAGAVTIVSPVTLGGPQTWLNNSANVLTLNGNVNNNGNLLTLNGTGSTSFDSTSVTISGTGGLTKNGNGNLNLRQTVNSFSGTFTINGGEVLTNGNIPSGNLTLNGGVLEDYWGGILTRGLGAAAGQVQVLGGASGFSGQGTTGLTVTINNSASFEVVWGAANEAGNASATGFFNPSTLVLQGPWANQGGNVTFQNKIDLNGTTRTIAVRKDPGATTGSATISGVIRTSSGTAGLTKTGVGPLILSAANTYNGPTTVNQGTLRAGNAAAFGNNSAVTLANVNGATLDLNNTSVSIGSLTGGGTTGGNVKLGSGTLTVGGDGTSPAAYAGIISGTGRLTKTGIGILTLSGPNSYSGATTINAGTLALGASNVLPDASAVSIGNGTLDAATFTDTAGTLAVTGSATINLGTGAALAFADSSAVAWTGTLNLTGSFVSGASHRFGTTSGGLTPAQLALITVSGSGGVSLDANGYLTGGSPYGSWAAGASFAADANGDGVANGLAWILGATDPSANGQAVLPTTGTEPGYLTLHFLRVHDLGPAKLYLEYSNDLNNIDPWHQVDLVNGPLDDIEVVDVPGSPNDDVTVKIPTSHASASGGLFARLQATEN